VLDLGAALISRELVGSVTAGETETLYAAALVHDIGLYTAPAGMNVEQLRAGHAALSAAWVVRNAERCRLGVDFARIVAEIVGAHQRTSDLANVQAAAHVSEPAWGDLRPRFLTALLRIADAADICRGRAPIAVYRHHEVAIPPASARHWRANELVDRTSIDLKYRQIVLHLSHDTDPHDPLLRSFYLALRSEFDAFEVDWMRWNQAVDLAIVFKHRGRYIVPGALYAGMLEERERDREP